MQCFRLVSIKAASERQAFLQVNVKVPEKRLKPTTKYVENRRTATTVCEEQRFQRTQYHLDLQLFEVCIDVDPSRGPIKRPNKGPSRGRAGSRARPDQRPEQGPEQGHGQGPEQGPEQRPDEQGPDQGPEQGPEQWLPDRVS